MAYTAPAGTAIAFDFTGSYTAPGGSAVAFEMAVTVSIYQPSTDVLATGWVPSTGSVLWDMIDEVAASDGDYITSPSINGSQGAAICGLNSSMVAGNYMVKIRANATTTGKQVRVSLLDGTNVSQGDTGWVNVTASYAEYDLPVATTGTATRVKMEVQ